MKDAKADALGSAAPPNVHMKGASTTHLSADDAVGEVPQRRRRPLARAQMHLHEARGRVRVWAQVRIDDAAPCTTPSSCMPGGRRTLAPPADKMTFTSRPARHVRHKT